MTCEECMSREVVTIHPNSLLLEAARLMRELGMGALPVCQSGDPQSRLLGIVTDRDIVVRVIAEDLDLERVSVAEVMSSPVVYCFSDESPWVALHLMEHHLIRRLPVLDRQSHRLVGMLSISDLSRASPNSDEGASSATPWDRRVVEVMGSHRGWSDLPFALDGISSSEVK
jgi:CBS domain-containing protein